jgi:hypothetical protein
MRFAQRFAMAISVAILSSSTVYATGSCSFGFLPGTDYTAGALPGDIAVGYFNNDAYLDAAIQNRTSTTITILLGTAGGGFTPGTNITMDDSSQNDIIAGDINGDGKTDLAVACGSGTRGHLQVMLGAGDGTFTKIAFTPEQQLIFQNPDRIAPADFTGDGKLDAVVTKYGAISSMISVGSFFAQKAEYSVTSPGEGGGLATDVAAGDFDHDGKLDVVVSEQIYNRIIPFWGVGDGTFVKGTPITMTPTFTGNYVSRLGAGDFNGDGYADITVAWNDPYGSQDIPPIAMMLSNGAGRSFGAPVTYGNIAFPQDISVVDMNGDGKLDVVIGGAYATSIFLGNGNGTMQSGLTLPASDAIGIAIGDMDRDGAPDIIGTRFTPGKATVSLATCGRVTLAIGSSANPANYGTAVTVTGTLTSPPAAAATGTLTLSRNATPLATQSLNAGTSLNNTSTLPVGSYTYTIDYSGDARFIASSKSLTQTINPPPFGPPPGVTAFGTGGAVSLSWIATSGTDHYEIWRNSGAGYVSVGTSVAAAFTDNTPPASSALLYEVRAISPTNVPSAFSTPDLASSYTFTDEPITVGLKVKLVHLTQLRTAANAARVLAGLSPVTWAESSPVIVKASHWNEVRNAIDGARLQVGIGTAAYSEAVATGLRIKAVHVNETRSALR